MVCGDEYAFYFRLCLARNRASDFALFELQETIPLSYGVYLAGWSIRQNTPAYAVGIHHPSGDVKKISLANDPLDRDCWSECPKLSHWKVKRWTIGTTEPGSSGSGLFDDQGRVIGQLHGGPCSCSNLSYDVYGALFASYNSSSLKTQRLMEWLNPTKLQHLVSIPGVDLNTLRKMRK